MNLTTRIAIRHLRSRYSFGFISFSTILSILGLIIGISSLIIISCISHGFSKTVSDKLSGIDGHIRVSSFSSNSIRINKINAIDSTVHLILDDIEHTSPYIEKHAVVKFGSSIEGIIIYGVPQDALNKIFHLERFVSQKFSFDNKHSIIIGKKLAELLNAKIGNEIILINFEKISLDQMLFAKNFTITNIFQTDFPEYDKLLAFVAINDADSFFEMNDHYSGLIINLQSAFNASAAGKIISEQIPYPYTATTWMERHGNLLEWLTIYDIPIKLIMIFIIAIGIFNIAASLWMIIVEKTKDFAILRSIGLKSSDVKRIILKEGFYIGMMGAIGGIILSFIIIHIQSTYQIIQLPSDVYFMEYLPIAFVSRYFLIYPICCVLITIIFSYFPAIIASKILPSIALRYE